MTIENAATPNPPILSYIKDLPNICSLAGLGCSLLAIYFLIIGLYPAAMIGMIWAVGFDWADGLIARKMKGRTGDDRAFGGTLDLLIDIVSLRRDARHSYPELRRFQRRVSTCCVRDLGLWRDPI